MSAPPGIEMINDFIEEVDSYIPALIKGMESLKKGAGQNDVLKESHRLAHTIRGASSLVGLSGLSQMALQMENFLEDIIAGKYEFTSAAFDAMQKTIELFREYCLGYMNGGVASRAMLKETIVAFQRLRGLSPEEEDHSLKELLTSIPQNEGVRADDNRGAEKGPQTGAGQIYRVGRQAGLESETKAFAGALPTEALSPDETALPPQLLESFYEEAEEHLEELGRSLGNA